MYNFIKVDSGRPFACFCIRCNTRMWAGDVEMISASQQVWADLNGPSFKAYYCDGCKQQAEKENLDTPAEV